MSDPKLAAQLQATSAIGVKLMGMVSNDSPALTKLLANLCKAAADSVGAIWLLCDGGFEREAWSIARSLFELAITAGYLRKHPDQIALYTNFSFILEKKLSDWMKVNKTPLPPDTVAMIESNYAEVESLYKSKGHWHTAKIVDMAGEVGLRDVYKGLYPMMSSASHGGYQLIETEAKSGYPMWLGLQFWWLIIRELNNEVKGRLGKELDAVWKESPITNIHMA